jgi:hypothetical protein
VRYLSVADTKRNCAPEEGYDVFSNELTGLVPALLPLSASSSSVPEVSKFELAFSVTGMFCLFIAAAVIGALALARWPERRRQQRARYAEITEQVSPYRVRTLQAPAGASSPESARLGRHQLRHG